MKSFLYGILGFLVGVTLHCGLAFVLYKPIIYEYVKVKYIPISEKRQKFHGSMGMKTMLNDAVLIYRNGELIYDAGKEPFKPAPEVKR